MIDENRLIIRPATLDDVDFCATTIIEAEMSSTDKNGTANYFEITLDEYRKYLIQMLEEEVDGCDNSLSSFVVAEYEGEVIAARGGWLECDCEDNMPSAILKANLFTYVLPKEKLLRGQDKHDIVNDIQIEREPWTYQVEYSYTKPEFRGNHIKGKLEAYHIARARSKGAKKIQAHVFKCNEKSIKANLRSGFHFVREYKSHHPLVKDYYPDDTMWLMEMDL